MTSALDDLYSVLGQLVVAAGAYDAALLTLMRDLVGDGDDLEADVRAVTGKRTYLGNGEGIQAAFLELIGAYGGQIDPHIARLVLLTGLRKSMTGIRNGAVHDPWRWDLSCGVLRTFPLSAGRESVTVDDVRTAVRVLRAGVPALEFSRPLFEELRLAVPDR